MQLINHGGYCCGMRHLYGFTNIDGENLLVEASGRTRRAGPLTRAQAFKTLLKEVDESPAFNRNCTDRGKTIEVILTATQIRSEGHITIPMLKKAKFKHVYTFNNSTGDTCYVFLRNPKGRLKRNHPNYKPRGW
jgi:hypothetical protein